MIFDVHIFSRRVIDVVFTKRYSIVENMETVDEAIRAHGISDGCFVKKRFRRYLQARTIRCRKHLELGLCCAWRGGKTP